MPRLDLKGLLIRYLPTMGRFRRAAFARWHAWTRTRESYAQHGEDRFVYDSLRGWDLSQGLYIDVGAHHPTRLSNTYLFYRHGHRGIAVEPVGELARLIRKTRPEDNTVHACCGEREGTCTFSVAKVPSLSSRSPLPSQSLWRRETVPLTTLDRLYFDSDVKWVYFLSIDAEGHDLQVIQGADRCLSHVLWICAEANDPESETLILDALDTRGFDLVTKIACNLILRNRNDEPFAPYQPR